MKAAMGWLLRLALCCCRRRDEPPDELEDMEAGIVLNPIHSVAERVRMLQERKHVEPRDEIKVAGPSIAERRKMLGGASGLSSKNLRTQRLERQCELCGLDVAHKDLVENRGLVFHFGCFKCCACKRSLRGVEHSSGDDDDDLLYCDERLVSCRRRLAAAARPPSLREAENQRISETDRDLAKFAKAEAVDLIGEDLEKLVGRGAIAPKCGLCGGAFAAGDRLIMQGMTKFHEHCVVKGGTGTSVPQCVISRERALADAPSTILIKLRLPGTGRDMTFFAARERTAATARELLGASGLAYMPDLQSNAPPRRRAKQPWVRDGVASLKLCGTSGLELAPAIEHPASDLRASFSWQGGGLDWRLDVEFELDHDAMTVAFQRAFLDLKQST